MGLDWTAILVALIGAGLLKFAIDGIQWLIHRWRNGPAEAQEAAALSTVDQSLVIVAKARDELEADNARLRHEIAEKDQRYAAEMARRDARETQYRAEIDKLEAKVREILAELENLKHRHDV